VSQVRDLHGILLKQAESVIDFVNKILALIYAQYNIEEITEFLKPAGFVLPGLPFAVTYQRGRKSFKG
jgi:hypothetical protein